MTAGTLTCADGVTPTADITIRRGDDVPIVLRFRDRVSGQLINFSLWSNFAAKVKDKVDGSVLVTAVISGLAGGVVNVLLPHAQTATLTPGQIGVWDAQADDPNGLVRTIVAGKAAVIGDVT